jgi:hypothetical protein
VVCIYILKNKYSFPVFQVETEIPKAFNAVGIPVTFLISRDRKIALRHIGGTDWSHEKVINYINELIGEEKVQGSEVHRFRVAGR